MSCAIYRAGKWGRDSRGRVWERGESGNEIGAEVEVVGGGRGNVTGDKENGEEIVVVVVPTVVDVWLHWGEDSKSSSFPIINQLLE